MSRLSLTAAGSLTQAAFGGESAGGDGNPELDVCHNTPSGLIAFAAVQPGGSVGGVMPSKFWDREQKTGVGVGVAVTSANGVVQAATSNTRIKALRNRCTLAGGVVCLCIFEVPFGCEGQQSIGSDLWL